MYITASVPLRVSLIGGGSDMTEYLKTGEDGCVLSYNICQRVHFTLSEDPTDSYGIRFPEGSSEYNTPLTVSVLETGLASGTPFKTNGILVNGHCDLGTTITGLGFTSSWTTAGLIACEEWMKPTAEGINFAPLMYRSYRVERDAGSSCGLHDHASAVNGGVGAFTYVASKNRDMSVSSIKSLSVGDSLNYAMIIKVDGAQPTDESLSAVASNVANDIALVKRMSELAKLASFDLEEERIVQFGEKMREAWELKKKLANGAYDTPEVKAMEQLVDGAGAQCYKMLGTGPGGYMYVLCADQFAEARVINAIKQANPKAKVHEVRPSYTGPLVHKVTV